MERERQREREQGPWELTLHTLCLLDEVGDIVT